MDKDPWLLSGSPDAADDCERADPSIPVNCFLRVGRKHARRSGIIVQSPQAWRKTSRGDLKKEGGTAMLNASISGRGTHEQRLSCPQPGSAGDRRQPHGWALEPHDHGTWGVVAAVEGPEKNEFFERIDDRSRPGHAELRKTGEKVWAPGDVVTMPRGVIHSVSNVTDAMTVSLHIYGKHINYTGRSQFDLEAKTETPFLLDVRE